MHNRAFLDLGPEFRVCFEKEKMIRWMPKVFIIFEELHFEPLVNQLSSLRMHKT